MFTFSNEPFCRLTVIYGSLLASKSEIITTPTSTITKSCFMLPSVSVVPTILIGLPTDNAGAAFPTSKHQSGAKNVIS